jgi:hypothetical protein
MPNSTPHVQVCLHDQQTWIFDDTVQTQDIHSQWSNVIAVVKAVCNTCESTAQGFGKQTLCKTGNAPYLCKLPSATLVKDQSVHFDFPEHCSADKAGAAVQGAATAQLIRAAEQPKKAKHSKGTLKAPTQ